MNLNNWLKATYYFLSMFFINIFLSSHGIAGQFNIPEYQPLVGLYESTVININNPQKVYKRSWYLIRSEGHLEIRDMQGHEGELWEKENDGQIYYTKLFHKQKQAIDYLPGDLLALERKVNWNKINQIIDTNLFGEPLHFIGGNTIQGRFANIYQGKINEVKTKVHWLEREKIPASIRQSFRDKTVTIELQEVWQMNQAPISHTIIDKYHHTDFSDIGDLEADPFLKQLIHQGFGHNHSRFNKR